MLTLITHVAEDQAQLEPAGCCYAVSELRGGELRYCGLITTEALAEALFREWRQSPATGIIGTTLNEGHPEADAR